MIASVVACVRAETFDLFLMDVVANILTEIAWSWIISLERQVLVKSNIS